MILTEKNYNVLCDGRGLYEEEIIEQILQNRGIDNPEHFFNPTQNDLLPYLSMPWIMRASIIVKTACQHNYKIHVFFDTDLDGISSGAIMTRYLKNFTDNIETSINEGKAHGLVGQDLSRFNDTDLLIIVDSLDNTIEQYKYLHDKGVEIIILDHHAINENIPYDDYVTLVSSQREAYQNKALSGAGVVWKFCKYLDTEFNTNYADELTDLAVCGLIADMVDMTNMENRYIAYKGLSKINNPAIKKIIGGYEFNSTAISFSVAPIVNASNRMFKNEIAMKAFLANENKEVLAYIKELKKCREEQNEIVAECMESAHEQCNKMFDKTMMIVFNDVEYGVNGLIGNKLLEEYQRPILVLKDTGDTYSGSMRAIGVDDFRKICNDSGLAQADGHELASGIIIKKENFNNFVDYIEENVHLEPKQDIDVDIELSVEDITRKLIDEIKKIDYVSGTNHKQIKVLVKDIDMYGIGQMSDYKHLVIKPRDYLLMIKWNFKGSFEEMEDHSLMNDEIQVCGSLDSGFLARKFVLKLICDDVKVVD